MTATNAEANGGRTGWPPGMLQDDCSDLSRWFASKPDSWRLAAEAAARAAERRGRITMNRWDRREQGC